MDNKIEFFETIPELNIRCPKCKRTGTLYKRSITWGSDLDYSPFWLTSLICSNCNEEYSSRMARKNCKSEVLN